MDSLNVYFQFGNLRWDHRFIRNGFINGNWKERAVKIYPELSELSKSKDFDKELKIFLIDLYRKNFNEIADSVVKYQRAWDKVNVPFMNAVSKVIEVKPPTDILIQANVGVNPIAPRNWQYWNFCLYYKTNEEQMIGTTAHEITHFFYFKKLMEKFPNIDQKTFNRPHIEWVLSEILAPIILNDSRIVKVIGKTKMKTYACDDETLAEFNELYKKHLKKKTSFVEFYKEAKKMTECMPKK